jgi:hypothetical protein
MGTNKQSARISDHPINDRTFGPVQSDLDGDP